MVESTTLQRKASKQRQHFDAVALFEQSDNFQD
jgi:hypothetical protein